MLEIDEITAKTNSDFTLVNFILIGAFQIKLLETKIQITYHSKDMLKTPQ